MTDADKQKLRTKLVKTAKWFAPLAGKEAARYVFVARMTDGGTAPIPIIGTPTRATWKRALQMLQQLGKLEAVVMAVVVDTRGGRVLYEHVTPRWAELPMVPGLKEYYQGVAASFFDVVMPWSH